SPTKLLERQCTTYNCVISSGSLACKDPTGVTTVVPLSDPRINN
ncbi:10186_t:CDS:1, partial [Scutellospora calospora]